jgi:hypothetical protein
MRGRGYSAVTPLTGDKVIAALGEVDECMIAELENMGASPEELAEVQAWIANEEALINAGTPLPSGREGWLVEILRSIEEEEPGPRAARQVHKSMTVVSPRSVTSME